MRLTLFGFGLIGGSIALALAEREAGDWQVTVCSRSTEGPRRALARGVIAAVAPDPEAAVRDADLVILAASPAANLALVDLIAPSISGRDVTLSDVSSVQRPIAERAAQHERVRFVGGHPMSGRERRGFGAATSGLFVARPWIVVPSATALPKDVARVRRLALSSGAEPIELDAATHDEAVAAISHLPLLVSIALAEAVLADPRWAVARPLAAQGWRDTTRLARGDPELGAGILSLNAVAVRAWLDLLRARLDEWDGRLASQSGQEADAADLGERLARVASALEGER